jgi:hypothetical protein
LAFRSVTTSLQSKRDQIKRILQLPPPASSSASEANADEAEVAARDLEDAVAAYLRRAADTFDLTKNAEVSMKHQHVLQNVS